MFLAMVFIVTPLIIQSLRLFCNKKGPECPTRKNSSASKAMVALIELGYVGFPPAAVASLDFAFGHHLFPAFGKDMFGLND
jgi:hypothetical protein